MLKNVLDKCASLERSIKEREKEIAEMRDKKEKLEEKLTKTFKEGLYSKPKYVVRLTSDTVIIEKIHENGYPMGKINISLNAFKKIVKWLQNERIL